MAEVVLYEVKDQIAYITMNRPDKLNALNNEMVSELNKTWDRFESDPESKVAERLNKLAPLSLRIIKYGMYKIMDTPVAQAEREFKKFVQPQFDSEDFKEGAKAFQEKREPLFKGK